MDRPEPDLRADERTSLCQFLDTQRAAMLRLVDGVPSDGVGATVGSSTLTLGGLLKHLALVEDAWFVETFVGEPLPEPWASIDWDSDPDWEFRTGARDDLAASTALYRSAVDRSRSITDAAPSLDALSVGTSRRDATRGERFSLRWILLHMIEETARHLGHADLIRQAVDGATDV